MFIKYDEIELMEFFESEARQMIWSMYPERSTHLMIPSKSQMN